MEPSAEARGKQFEQALTRLQEARDRRISAEIRRLERRTRIGLFFVSRGVARAQRALAKSNARYNKTLLHSSQPQTEVPTSLPPV